MQEGSVVQDRPPRPLIGCLLLSLHAHAIRLQWCLSALELPSCTPVPPEAPLRHRLSGRMVGASSWALMPEVVRRGGRRGGGSALLHKESLVGPQTSPLPFRHTTRSLLFVLLLSAHSSHFVRLCALLYFSRRSKVSRDGKAVWLRIKNSR